MSIVDFGMCMAEDTEKMKTQEIQDCVRTLLFDEKFQKKYDATDKEKLTLIVREDKSGHFDFLRNESLTEWKSIGSWRGLKEKNEQMEVEFKDRKDEKIGQRLMELLNAFNKRVIGEELLYARTTPIEESTL